MTDLTSNPNPLGFPAIDLVELAFARAYVENGCNAEQAAISIGYRADMAIAVGADMRVRPAVRFLIGQMMADKGATLERCLLDLINRAFAFDPADYSDYLDCDLVHGEGGKLRMVKLKDLRDRGVPTRYIKRMSSHYNKDGTTTRTLEFQDGLKALQLLLGGMAGKYSSAIRPIVSPIGEDHHPGAKLFDVSDNDEEEDARGEDEEMPGIPFPPGLEQPPFKGMGSDEEDEDEEGPETAAEEET